MTRRMHPPKGSHPRVRPRCLVDQTVVELTGLALHGAVPRAPQLTCTLPH